MLSHFCRSMLCISAAYAVMRCLCVCLSRSWIMSKRLNITSFFSPSGSHTILGFPYQTGWRYSDGDPPNGGVECRWGRQILSLYLALVPAVNAATGRCCQHGRQWTTATVPQVLTHGSKRWCWLRKKTTKCMTRSLNVTPKTTEQRI